MAIIKIRNAAIDLDAAEIPNIDASKITSGSIADARIPASAVSQHATSFDDNKIVNDISTLAIRQASNENKGAYNTNSMYVDVFQDDTGIASHTTSARNSNEYVSSISSSTAAFTADSNTELLFHMDDNTESKHGDSTISTGPHAEFNTSQVKFGTKSLQNYNIDNSMATYPSSNRFNVGTGALTVEAWVYVNDRTDSYGQVVGHWWASSGSSNEWSLRAYSSDISDNFGVHDGSSMRNSGQQIPLNAWHHIAWTRDGSGNNALWYDGTQKTTWSNSNDHSLGTKDVHFGAVDTISAHQYNGRTDEVRFSNIARYSSTFTPNEILTTSATGNFISNVITAPSSTNKMGAIITYQDQAGTNALNTDIVLQLSADNGSNFTTATLTAMPDFASGIKMAKVNDLSVTAGTQLKYKISFANQSGSKEARIRGVSLQY